MKIISEVGRFCGLSLVLLVMSCTKSNTVTPDNSRPLGPTPIYGLTSYTLNVDGTNRAYKLYVPASYTPAKKSALVLGLHGGGADGASVIKTSSPTGSTTENTILNLADADGVLMVFPDGLNKGWNDGREEPSKVQDDVRFLSRLIDEIATFYQVDQARVYALGISNGGMMSMRLACDLSSRVRAIATIVGNIPKKLMPNCNPTRAVPINMFNGVNDTLVPWDGGFVTVPITNEQKGEVESVLTTADFFATMNGCDLTKQSTNLPDTSADGTTVTLHEYENCPGSGEVRLYQVNGGGHTWPGGWQYVAAFLVGKTTRDITANSLIWDFFKRQGM